MLRSPPLLAERRSLALFGVLLAGAAACHSSPETECFAGCLCFSTPETCPTGCFPSHEPSADGGEGAFFCANGAAPKTTDAAAEASADADEAGPGADCVPQGEVYVCQDSDAALLVCPASANPEQPCEAGTPECMGCDRAGPPTGVGAGFTCTCDTAGLVPGQDAALWDCVGTEHTCR